MHEPTAVRPRARARPITPRIDWRAEIPAGRRQHLRAWFWSGAILTFLILVIGGVTRLTQSGLSMVEWRPVMGIVPPLGQAEWQAAFERYRRFPEYRMLRQGMTLSEFRFIFLWEYVHRLAARLIGIVFLVPFGVFWLRGYFTRPLLWRVLALLGLGVLQGLMGWFMVRSGLVDDPQVSHYRLAAHLAIALTILGYCVWLARESGPRRRDPAAGRPVRSGRAVGLLGGLLLTQILGGALVAGLRAGRIFNTFPLMGGRLAPPGAWRLRPVLLNLVENPATVQWTHRVIGTLLVLAALAVFLLYRRAGAGSVARRLSATFTALVLLQYGLGIATLLHGVPVALGAVHQATAVLVLGTWVVWLHYEVSRISVLPGTTGGSGNA
ncbi:MAG TPA: COX15/CtaA family protein [Longimicrobiaceae bacterium]|nr:COX15/CtaA family protein [Longimicrobiaceae bacterium]